jgi:hypothetical protein
MGGATTIAERGKDLKFDYSVLPRGSEFSVRVIFPQNTIHLIGGFKSEADARLWIEEVCLLRTRFLMPS